MIPGFSKNSYPFLPIIFLLTGYLTFAQNHQVAYKATHEVIYTVTFVADTLQPQDKKVKTLYLLTNGETGIAADRDLLWVKRIKKQSLSRSGGLPPPPPPRLGSSRSIDINFKKVFYKDLQTGEIWTVGTLSGLDFLYHEPHKIEWEVMTESKKVADFEVIQAKTSYAGRDYIAWFAPQIPIPDGPMVFTGLPGLILEIYDTQNRYHFLMESLFELEEPTVFKLPKAKSVSKAEFKELEKREPEIATNLTFEDQSRIMINGKMRNRSEYIRILEEDLKSQNNPMERSHR